MTLTVEQRETPHAYPKTKPHATIPPRRPIHMKSREQIERERQEYQLQKEHDAQVEKGRYEAQIGMPSYICETGLGSIANLYRDKQKVSGSRQSEEGGTQKTKAYFSKFSAYFAVEETGFSGVNYYLTSDVIDNSKVQGYNSKCAAKTTKHLKGEPTVDENGTKTYADGTTVSVNEDGYEVTVYPDGSEKYERVFGEDEQIYINNTAFEVGGLKLTAIYDENGNMITQEIKK